MASRRFKETVEFIKTVHRHPELWDIRHHMRTAGIVRDTIWVDIGRSFNINGASAISIWKNLCAKFRRELRRSYRNTPKYRSSWVYFDHMLFIKGQLRQNNLFCPLASPKKHKRSKQKDGSSSIILLDSETDDIEVVETTNDAFIWEFPRPSYFNSTPEPDGEDLQKEMEMLVSVDPDVGFLASLLPHLRSVKAEKKALLKNRLLQVIHQYCPNVDIGDKTIDFDESDPSSGSEEEVELN